MIPFSVLYDWSVLNETEVIQNAQPFVLMRTITRKPHTRFGEAF